MKYRWEQGPLDKLIRTPTQIPTQTTSTDTTLEVDVTQALPLPLPDESG